MLAVIITWSRGRSLKATRLSRLLDGYAGMGFSKLQGYQGYRRGMQGWICQGYKAIKATGGWHRARILKATRLSRLQGGVCRDGFLKVTRLSRLQEGNAGMDLSRLLGYQGYSRVAPG